MTDDDKTAVEAMIEELDFGVASQAKAADIMRAQQATIEALRADVARLNERLENNRVYSFKDGQPIREDVEPGSIPDGIDCRNETIKGLEHIVADLRAQLAAVKAERDEARAYAHETTKALTGLTPGGSEWFAGRFKNTDQYKADIPRIFAFIKENRVYKFQLTMAEKQRDEARAALAKAVSDEREACAEMAISVYRLLGEELLPAGQTAETPQTKNINAAIGAVYDLASEIRNRSAAPSSEPDVRHASAPYPQHLTEDDAP